MISEVMDALHQVLALLRRAWVESEDRIVFNGWGYLARHMQLLSWAVKTP